MNSLGNRRRCRSPLSSVPSSVDRRGASGTLVGPDARDPAASDPGLLAEEQLLWHWSRRTELRPWRIKRVAVRPQPKQYSRICLWKCPGPRADRLTSSCLAPPGRRTPAYSGRRKERGDRTRNASRLNASRATAAAIQTQYTPTTHSTGLQLRPAWLLHPFSTLPPSSQSPASTSIAPCPRLVLWTQVYNVAILSSPDHRLNPPATLPHLPRSHSQTPCSSRSFSSPSFVSPTSLIITRGSTTVAIGTAD